MFFQLFKQNTTTLFLKKVDSPLLQIWKGKLFFGGDPACTQTLIHLCIKCWMMLYHILHCTLSGRLSALIIIHFATWVEWRAQNLSAVAWMKISAAVAGIIELDEWWRSSQEPLVEEASGGGTRAKNILHSVVPAWHTDL